MSRHNFYSLTLAQIAILICYADTTGRLAVLDSNRGDVDQLVQHGLLARKNAPERGALGFFGLMVTRFEITPAGRAYVFALSMALDPDVSPEAKSKAWSYAMERGGYTLTREVAGIRRASEARAGAQCDAEGVVGCTGCESRANQERALSPGRDAAARGDASSRFAGKGDNGPLPGLTNRETNLRDQFVRAMVGETGWGVFADTPCVKREGLAVLMYEFANELITARRMV